VSNAAHAAAAQTTPPKMIARAPADVFSPALAGDLHDDDAAVMAKDAPIISTERLISISPEDPRWVLVTKVPLHNEDEQVVGLVGVARDITLRKQAEEALRKSEEYLQAVIA